MKKRFGAATAVLVIVLALSAASGATAYASHNSLPGDILYPVKLGTEEMMMLLPNNNATKIKQALERAERRVEEIQTLVGQGRLQDLAPALQEYDRALTMALTRMTQVCNKSLNTQNLTTQVAEATATHLFVLDGVWDKVPDQAKAAIAQTQEVSQRGYQNALAALARNKPISALEINLVTMSGRLTRIRDRASRGNTEALQIALQQFEDMARFGREIFQIAEETGSNLAEVAQLVVNATSIHLEVLQELHEDVPEQMSTAVQRAMEQSFRFYEMMINICIASNIEESQLPALPEKTRQRIEQILGWADVPKAGIPTDGGSRQSCPSCRR